MIYMQRKYKGITIPYHYTNKKANYTCYIYNDQEYLDLNSLFQDFLGLYLTYHYEAKDKLYEVHNLSEVLEALLKNKDTFKIPKEYQEEYSEEELKYIKGLQKCLINDTLKIAYDKNREFNKKDYPSTKSYNMALEVYDKYRKVVIPKKVNLYNHNYYVVAGEYFESIYHALDYVYNDNLYYQFGGTKKENNRNHLHSHSFDDLISLIFSNSEEFKIHVFQRQYYSKQELDFLTKLANKLKKMNFHSITFNPDKIEYEEYWYLKDEKKFFKLLINNIRWHRLNKQYEKDVLESHKR